MYSPSSVAVVDVDRHPELIEQLLLFGRDLQSLYSRLTREKPNRALQVLLQDSFSLLAYTDPHSSPVRYLLQPSQREPVCAALNSAILREHTHTHYPLSHFSPTLGANNLPGQPPLEFALGQASQCLHLMTRNGMGAATFTGVQEILKPS